MEYVLWFQLYKGKMIRILEKMPTYKQTLGCLRMTLMIVGDFLKIIKFSELP